MKTSFSKDELVSMTEKELLQWYNAFSRVREMEKAYEDAEVQKIKKTNGRNR